MTIVLAQMVIGHLKSALCRQGLRPNGAELRCHLEETQPNLIILDLRLGQDDGLDLLR
jgi:DNA-binding response OmpR family regulator